MLARNRFNEFTLTFGHQTNYLNPVYPWLLDDPEVRVRGLSDEQRAENLRMLARIAELAKEHGLKPETIEQALATDLDVTVSTKFWCEHMRLPGKRLLN